MGEIRTFRSKFWGERRAEEWAAARFNNNNGRPGPLWTLATWVARRECPGHHVKGSNVPTYCGTVQGSPMGYVRLVVSRKRPVRTRSQCSQDNGTVPGTFSLAASQQAGLPLTKPANLLGGFEARALGINTLVP